MSESDLEAPTADAVEQAQIADDDDESFGDDGPLEIPLDVNEADAAEQHRTVELDDDDYR
jgi:hypothetical protein